MCVLFLFFAFGEGGVGRGGVECFCFVVFLRLYLIVWFPDLCLISYFVVVVVLEGD